MAKEQAVKALLLDGMEYLPSECRPPISQWASLCSSMVGIEQLNESSNQKVAEVVKLLEDEGFHPLILKGQVIAQEYPNPLHRQCGDIDVWISDTEEAERAFRWAKKNYNCRWMPGEKETSFKWKGVTVELHRRIAEMQYPSYNKVMQRIIGESAPDVRMVAVGKASIRTTSVLLTAYHLVAHLQYHLLAEGIGLRQVCDLALFLTNHNEELRLKSAELNEWLHDSGLFRIAQSIGWVLHHSLGVALENIPFGISSEGANMILDDIITGGNFGKNKYGHVSSYGFFRRKFYMLPVHWKQYLKYRHLLPREAEANFMSKFVRALKGVK